jgi:hypothetical protein
MQEIDALIARFAAAPGTLQATVARIPEEALDRSPGTAEWTTRQIVCHLADAELVGAVRLRMVLGEEEPTLPLYAQDGWAERLQYARPDRAALDHALQQFWTLRAGSTRLLRQAPPERWTAVGIHPVRGRMTLKDLLVLYVEHAEGHIEQIRRAAGVLA